MSKCLVVVHCYYRRRRIPLLCWIFIFTRFLSSMTMKRARSRQDSHKSGEFHVGVGHLSRIAKVRSALSTIGGWSPARPGKTGSPRHTPCSSDPTFGIRAIPVDATAAIPAEPRRRVREATTRRGKREWQDTVYVERKRDEQITRLEFHTGSNRIPKCFPVDKNGR